MQIKISIRHNQRITLLKTKAANIKTQHCIRSIQEYWIFFLLTERSNSGGQLDGIRMVSVLPVVFKIASDCRLFSSRLYHSSSNFSFSAKMLLSHYVYPHQSTILRSWFRFYLFELHFILGKLVDFVSLNYQVNLAWSMSCNHELDAENEQSDDSSPRIRAPSECSFPKVWSLYAIVTSCSASPLPRNDEMQVCKPLTFGYKTCFVSANLLAVATILQYRCNTICITHIRWLTGITLNHITGTKICSLRKNQNTGLRAYGAQVLQNALNVRHVSFSVSAQKYEHQKLSSPAKHWDLFVDSFISSCFHVPFQPLKSSAPICLNGIINNCWCRGI